MNFLISIRVFIKTLNELLLIHLIGSEYEKYKYFSMFAHDVSDVNNILPFNYINKSYFKGRYKMIDGDSEFNSIQKERAMDLISLYKKSVNSRYGSYASGQQSTISGGYYNTSSVTSGSIHVSTTTPKQKLKVVGQPIKSTTSNV